MLLLDEPTNNLDIHSIGWLERALNDYDATMIIISHDRHFLNQVCTHIADLDLPAAEDLSGQLRRLHARVGAGARSASRPRTPRPRTGSRTCRNSCAASPPTPRRRARRPRASRQLEKIKIEEIRPSSRQNPYIRFEQGKKLYRSAVTVEKLCVPLSGHRTTTCSRHLSFNVEAGERVAIIGPNGVGKTTLMRCLAGELTPTAGRITWVENAQPGYMPQDPQAEFEAKMDLLQLDVASGRARRTTTRSCARPWAGCCSPATRPRSRSRCCPAARRAA